MSDRQRAILNSYEKSERFLNKEFLDTIDWDSVKNFPLDEKFIPVLVYMRDIEAFTDVYYQQLTGTPTGRDPIIRQFMDRWLHEEQLHAELLDRFLNEAGIPTSEKWYEEAREKIPTAYTVKSKVNKLMINCIGKRFSAVHMTWGAINELSTLQGYKRLWETAEHPVLEHILKGIAREESSHIFFYRSIAQLKLAESKSAQRIARYIIENFWTPVGQGTKPEEDTNYVIHTLFNGEGMKAVETHINGSLEKLPGFESVTAVSDKIAEAIDAAVPQPKPASFQ